VLTVVIADDGTSHDANLYQFLDFTRVENSQKNENRHFKWFGKLRRSNKNQKSVEQVSSQPEDEQYESVPKRPLLQAAFKMVPLSFHKPGKKSKESTYIVLPPLPTTNQAKSVGSQGPHHPTYISKQDTAFHQPGPPYSQTQPAPTGPAQNTQPSSFPPQQTPSYEAPPNSPVSPNAESEYHEDAVSPPAHSDSRYSKWFSKLKRSKSNQPQPEKPQHEPETLQNKPPNQASGAIPETIFYYQNGSPYNKPSATQNQPGNGQSPTFLRQPQIANGPSQPAPARPSNIQPQSAPPTHPGVFSSQINFDSRDNFPHSITEVLEQPPPSGNLYSKLIKKMKRNKTQKPEPVKVVSQAEPIFSPIQTENIPPSDQAPYRPLQSPPQQTPPRPAAANIVKPQSTATNLPSDPALYRRPQLPSQLSPPGPANIVKPQPTASPVSHSSHHQAPNKPATARPEAATPPAGNSLTKRPPATGEKQTHPLFPESETFFSSANRPDFGPTPFQKQTENKGTNESSDGFFEFGIFPNANDFFEQNFAG
jgi:hypothetical protein